MPVTILHTRDGKLDAADKTQLDALRARIGLGSPKILLHLHGGLVNETSGMAAATRLSGAGQHAFNAPPDWEQVYVVWRTGAIETLRTNWKDIFENDRLYRLLLKKIISLVSGKVIPAAAGRSISAEKGMSTAEVERRLLSGDDAPFADVDALTMDDRGAPRSRAVPENDADIKDEFADDLERDAELNAVAADIEAALTADAPQRARSFGGGDAVAGNKTLTYIDDRIAAPWHVEKAEGRSLIGGNVLISLVKHGVQIGIRVVKRYRAGRDHGLHATVVEEIVREIYGDLIGSIVWGMMKQDAADHFAPGSLGDALLDALAANAGRRLLLTGHSAGSIWASEMLIAAAKRAMPFPVDIAFLAPAVRTSKFAAALAANNGQIGMFRSFAMSDALERADILLGPGYGFLYPSSLLYFVSGICEEADGAALADSPLLGMQRYISAPSTWLNDPAEGPALTQVLGFLRQDQNRTVFSVSSAGPGLNSDAKSHGGFDDNILSLESVATFFA